MKRNRNRIVLLLLCMIAVLTCGCGRKKEPEPQTEAETEAETVPESEPELSPQVQEIVTSVLTTSKQKAFDLQSNIEISLDGSNLMDTIQVSSDICVVNGTTDGGDDLQMTIASTSNLDDIVAKAYYSEGYYYTDDKEGKKRVKKPASIVMKSVTDVSDLVVESAAKVDEVKLSEKNGEKTYTYHLPEYLVKSYLNQVLQGPLAKDTVVEGAKTEVTGNEARTTIGKDGYVTRQELTLEGKLMKSVVKIPVKVHVAADFQKSNKTDLTMPDFKDFNN